jgi:hypothetical protein
MIQLLSKTLVFGQNVRVIEEFGTKFADQTIVHPLALAAMLVSCVLVASLPRGILTFPLLVYICFVSPEQRFAVFGLDLHFTRLIILVGCIRVLLRKEANDLRYNAIDFFVLLFPFVKTTTYTFQQQTPAALIFQTGASFDWLGAYFLVRCSVKSILSLKQCGLLIAAISFPVMVFFLIERLTGRNLFSELGGVPEITVMRQGKLRCQGPFPHPIIAGCFWASLIPIILSSNLSDKLWKKWVCMVAVFNALMIIVFCNSSTPLGGVVAVVVGMLFFVLRGKMRWVVAAAVLLLFSLHMVMEAPVWHLISRVSFSHGSTSYFRFQLIDHTIKRFPEWAFVGTRSTAHWFWGAQDLANQYVFEAVRGGILSLTCFLTIIALSFKFVGKSVRKMGHSRKDAFLIWCLGVTLYVHCTNFLGVSYFGQASFMLVFNFAVIASSYAFSTGSSDADGFDRLHFEVAEIDRVQTLRTCNAIV